MMKLSNYIDHIRQMGKIGFSSEDAQKTLNLSFRALKESMARLRKKGALVTPYRGFHIMVPPEYRSFGCLPANQLIPPLMEYLKIPYYVCLLSAAELHGAAHQRPQIFQIMITKRLRPIQCGKITINFIFKKNLLNIPTQPFNVATGYLTVATPETTAMDLLLYPHQAGGINHIATVLTELIEAIDPPKLLLLAQSSREHAWIQRLGYLLDKIDPDEITQKNECLELLKKHIQHINPSYVQLINRKIKGSVRDKTWRLNINTEIESDL